MIRVRIPGEPKPHGRPRVQVRGGRPHTHTRQEDLDWRGRAQVHMQQAYQAHDLGPFMAPGEPTRVRVLAVFRCPTSDHRKRTPRPRRWHTKARGDADNLAKAVLDAGNGVLWLDDSQVAELHVTKLIGAQGEAPFVEVEVSPLNGNPDDTNGRGLGLTSP